MQYLWTMVCLKIVSVVLDESKDRKQEMQEMWIIQASNRHEIGVYCSRNEWKQVQRSCEHANECGWAAFMAQMAQEVHYSMHLQLAEQTASDHFGSLREGTL